MQNDRDLVLKEYFQLIILLNKGNKLKNQETHLKFKIENRELRAFLEPDEKRFLVLCLKTRSGTWEASGYSGLHFLEKQLEQFLSIPNNEDELYQLLKSFLFD